MLERLLANSSWRLFVRSVLTASTLLAGFAAESQACCRSFFGGSWGGCCGGGAYTAGYYGGYYGGYAPYYASYAPAYGYGYSAGYGYGATYAYGDAYASAGYGCSSCCNSSCCNSCCSSCVGGGCGIATTPVNPTRPVPDNGPDDGYRPLPGRGLNNTPPGDDTSTPRRSRQYNDETSPNGTPRAPGSGTTPRNDGFDGTGAARTGEPAEAGIDEKGIGEEFTTPRRSRSNINDRFDQGANRPPMPKADDTPMPKADGATPAGETKEKVIPPVDEDNFDDPIEEKSDVKVQRPDLGPSSETPVDANSTNSSDSEGSDSKKSENEDESDDTVIPPRKPVEIRIPEPEEMPPAPSLPENSTELNEKPTSVGVSPKARLARQGRFGTPSIVRIKVRPNSDWQPAAAQPVIAKH